MASKLTLIARRRLISSLLVSGGVHAAAVSIIILDVGFGLIPQAYSTKSNASSIQLIASAESEESIEAETVKVVVAPVVVELDSEEIERTIPPLENADSAEVESNLKSISESLQRRVLETATERIASVPSMSPSAQNDINHIATIQRKLEPVPELVTAPPKAEPTPRTAQRQEPARDATAAQVASAEFQENQGAEFDALPTPVLNPAPVYPSAALASKLEGRVVLRTTVDESGNVSKVSILRSSGHDALDLAALKAVKNWKFTPGQRFGRNASGQIAVPVVFQISR